MPESTATETDQTSRDFQHKLKLPVVFESFFNLSPNMMMSLDANITSQRECKISGNSQQTFGLDTPSAKINSSDYHSLATAEGFSTNVRGNLSSKLGKTELGATASVYYDNMKNDGESTGFYQYFQSGTMQNDRQHYHMPTRNLTVDASLQARSALGQNFTVYRHRCHKLMQSLNAPFPMSVTLLGIETVDKLLQPEKTDSSIFVTPSGIVTEVRLLHLSYVLLVQTLLFYKIFLCSLRSYVLLFFT